MILCRNSKVPSPDRDTDYFDIVAGVMEGDILAPYQLIICLDYVLRTYIDEMKENGLKLTKEKTECIISTINRSVFKIVDQFTYLGSYVSSTKKDINTRLAKVGTATDRLSVI